jgi:hypothetical protein
MLLPLLPPLPPLRLPSRPLPLLVRPPPRLSLLPPLLLVLLLVLCLWQRGRHLQQRPLQPHWLQPVNSLHLDRNWVWRPAVRH